MALKIARATADESVQRPLRLWFANRRDEALARLGAPDGARHAEEAAQLVALALAADWRHGAALGEALAAWTDDIAAYRTVKAGAERLLDELDGLGVQAWLPRAVALVNLVAPTLRLRPWEPVLLNYLGVALYGLNEAALAVPVLAAAQRLDPGVENVAANLAAARSRAARPPRLRLAPAHAAALRPLRTTLKALPGRALAASEPSRISFCIIVRDEEEMLPDCLASVRDHVDELIVVDTGSTDRSVEIAESFGATVLHFPWNGSFSDARNHGLERATGTHILWLDADERLEDGDGARLQELAAQRWREGHWLVETNLTGQEEVGTASTHLALRLFRNRPAYRFSGAIHEQIRSAMPTDLPERFAPSTLRIRHYGYLKSRIEAKDKHRRNLELLEVDLRRDPRNPFTHFNIGTEYVAMPDLGRARTHLEEAYRLISVEPSWFEYAYASLLAIRLIGVRRQTGDLEGADALAAELLADHPAFTDLVFERALCARARGDRAAARARFAACLAQGDAPPRFSGMVGRGSFMALAGLAECLAEEGDVEGAVALLTRSLEEHPTYLPPGLELAQLLLRLPDADPDAVLARLERFNRDELTWWLFLGTAFYERGHAVHAERLFRRALAKGAAHAAARVGLVEALLTQHRYAEVEQERCELPLGTLPDAALQRSRALAGVLTGNATAVTEAVGRLATGGGDPAEVALLRAFAHAAGAAEGTPPRLGVESATYALRILDALARLEEFDAFGLLVPVAEAAIGDPHLAALTLGELYLGRGFYRLAADAALRALDRSGPDARGLALLGKAAVAEGLWEDALPILEQSLGLDPSQSPVRTLVDELRRRAPAAA